MPVTLRVTLDQRQHRRHADGTFPVVLRVRKGTYRDYPVVYGNMAVSMTREDYARTQTERPREPWAMWRRRFAAIEQHARELVQAMPVFTHDQFREVWVDRSDREDVFDWMRQHIERQKKASTRRTYTKALESLQAFHGRTRLTFPDLTRDFLTRYAQHLGNNSTISTYFAPIKAACTRAQRKGVIRPEFNPFNDFTPPTTNSRADAVYTLEEMGRIATAPAQGIRQQWARDMFLLSYWLVGMPPVDLFSLVWDQVDRERNVITYVRQKTKDRKKKTAPTVLGIRPEAWAIIDAHAVRLGSRRVFPRRPWATRKEDKPTAMNGDVNYHFRLFCIANGITYRSMYAARHSALTHLRDRGIKSAIAASSAGTSEQQLNRTYHGQASDGVAWEVAAALGGWK